MKARKLREREGERRVEKFTKHFSSLQAPAKYWVVPLLATHPMCRTRRESSSRKCFGPRTQLLSGCRCRSRHTTWVPQPRHKPKIRIHNFRCAFVEQLLRLVRVRDRVRDTRTGSSSLECDEVAYNFSGNLQGYKYKEAEGKSREFAKEELILNKKKIFNTFQH